MLLSDHGARSQGQEIDRNVVQQCTVSLTPLHHALISPRWPAALQLLAMERAGAAKPPVRSTSVGGITGISAHSISDLLVNIHIACKLVMYEPFDACSAHSLNSGQDAGTSPCMSGRVVHQLCIPSPLQGIFSACLL